jgi:hypothetical protein
LRGRGTLSANDKRCAAARAALLATLLFIVTPSFLPRMHSVEVLDLLFDLVILADFVARRSNPEIRNYADVLSSSHLEHGFAPGVAPGDVRTERSGFGSHRKTFEGGTKMRRQLFLMTTLTALGLLLPRSDAPALVSLEFADGWARYEHSDSGLRLDYPQWLFAPEPLDRNSTRFLTPDGRAELIVFHRPMPGRRTLDDIAFDYLNATGRPEVTYRKAFGRSLVLSGYRGSNIFYVRKTASPEFNAVEGFDLSYPRVWRERFDPIVTRMSRSFRSS